MPIHFIVGGNSLTEILRLEKDTTPKTGLTFKDEAALKKFFIDYSNKFYSPINFKKDNGGIYLYCPHSRKQESSDKVKARIRLNKLYNDANPCQVKGRAKLNPDNSYTITSLELTHNHPTNAELYGTYSSVRARMENIHKPKWETYAKAKTTKNVAEVLSKELKLTYTAKDIRNRVNKVNVSKETDVSSLKENIEKE